MKCENNLLERKFILPITILSGLSVLSAMLGSLQVVAKDTIAS